jgi:hypothetical protein
MLGPSFARGRANIGRALTAPVRFNSALPGSVLIWMVNSRRGVGPSGPTIAMSPDGAFRP